MRRTSVTFLVALAAVACTATSPTPSPPRSVALNPTGEPNAYSPLPAPSANPTAQPDVTPATGLVEMPLDIPPYLIESVDAKGQVDDVAHHTGEFVYTSSDQVFLGNIVRGTSSLFTADAGYQLMGVDSTFGDSGPLYGWAEGRYDNSTGRAPCIDVGAVTWRLFVDNGSQDHLVTSGVNSRLRSCTAAKPLFAFDGNDIAYAEEVPRDGHPNAWQIDVVNALTDQSVQTLETDGDIFSLDSDNGTIAWTEGTLDPNVDPNIEFGTTLMLASPGGASPVKIAAGAYDVSMREGRLAWVGDMSASQRDDNAPGPEIMTATVSDPTPVSLGPLTGLPPRPPIAGGDLVTWVEGDQIILADPNVGMQWRLTGTGNADSAGASSQDTSLDWLAANDNGSELLNESPLLKLSPPLPDFDATSPTPSATPVPTPTPTTSATASPRPAIPVALPADAIRSVQASGERFSQSGPLVAYTDGAGIELADLEHQKTAHLFSLFGNEQADSLAISGGTVVFTVATYDHYGSSGASCPYQGPVTWRIVAHDVATDRDTTVATGRSVQVGVCAAVPPPVSIDGDRVAYGREGGQPGSWTITVQSLSTGKVLRSVDTDGTLWSLGVDGLDVAYIETNWPNDRLMLSAAEHPAPVEIALAVEDMSFANGRLAWSGEIPDAWDVCWTVKLPDLVPVRVSTDDFERILSPQTADGFVAYATSTGDSGIALWDERVEVTYELLGSNIYPDFVSVGGGWVAWFSDPDNGQSAIQGLPITAIPVLGGE